MGNWAKLGRVAPNDGAHMSAVYIMYIILAIFRGGKSLWSFEGAVPNALAPTELVRSLFVAENIETATVCE